LKENRIFRQNFRKISPKVFWVHTSLICYFDSFNSSSYWRYATF
jgi:hypothetical protein